MVQNAAGTSRRIHRVRLPLPPWERCQPGWPRQGLAPKTGPEARLKWIKMGNQIKVSQGKERILKCTHKMRRNQLRSGESLWCIPREWPTPSQPLLPSCAFYLWLWSSVDSYMAASPAAYITTAMGDKAMCWKELYQRQFWQMYLALPCVGRKARQPGRVGFRFPPVLVPVTEETNLNVFDGTSCREKLVSLFSLLPAPETQDRLGGGFIFG